MSKKVLVWVVLIHLTGLVAINGQDICVPSETYADSSAGVYPLPYHELLFPDGGIDDTVCIGTPFDYTFTAVLEDSIKWMGFSFKLNSLEILPNGVLNLPAGLQYGCNPPNCLFLANTMGCLKIFGTATEENQPGQFDLKLRAKIVVANGLLTVIDTLPDLLIPGSHYYLEVEPASGNHCQTSSLENQVKKSLVELFYQPVNEKIRINLNQLSTPWLEFEILDMTGKIWHSKQILNPGLEPFNLDISMLSQGLYYCRVRTPQGFSGLKFVVMN
jgi:hypothetical protein